MIQTVISCLWVFFASIFFGTLAVICSLFSRTGNIVHSVAQIWARTILLVSRIRVRVIGLEQIDPGGSYIYFSNHQSNFDIPVLLADLKVQFRWLAKAELFKIPIFGQGMSGAGYISIDRSNRRSAMRSLIAAAETIRNGTAVLIFPEGTRSTDGCLLPFKKGGFVLAVDAGVPVVPIAIHGTRFNMAKGRMRIRPGNVVVKVCRPIETTDYSRKTKDALLETVRQAIVDAMEELEEDRKPC